MAITMVTPAMVGFTLPTRVRSRAAGRAGIVRVRSEEKGFGKKSAAPTNKAKVNSRGKVTSRPGIDKSKSEYKQQEEAARVLQERQAAAEEMQEEYQEAARGGVPEVVSNRMITRVITFAGIPMVTGFFLFPAFYYFKVIADPPVDIPNWTAGVASALTFGGAAVGISYGVLSASWNPSIKGSALGLEEIQQNIPIFMRRFQNDDK